MNATVEAMQPQDDRAAPGLLGLAERGQLPDALLRAGIRRLCAQRLREEHALDPDAAARRHSALVADLRQSAVALHVDAANRQHYELPPGFFERCLGPRLGATTRQQIERAADGAQALALLLMAPEFQRR